MNYRRIYMFLFFCTFCGFSFSQEVHINKELQHIRVGVNVGKASQSSFPFNDANYDYSNSYVKMQVAIPLLEKNKLSLEGLIEPSIYFSKHQLLNADYIQPFWGENYLELRERFMQVTTFNEYVLNVGLVARYGITKNGSIYLLGSIGPMFASRDSERLNRGFAFSDIAGVGISYKWNNIFLDFRTTIRHNSNAGIFEPNSGHNSVGLEGGVSYILPVSNKK